MCFELVLKSTSLIFWSHLPIIQGYSSLTKCYIYPLMPSPTHLLPLTGSAHRAVHR